MNDKNRHPLHALDDDALPPPDWDPAMDADESWQRMVALMEHADSGPSLASDDAEGLRAALREQLSAEGLVGNRPKEEETSLFAWFRLLLVGGGAGGQMIRLGVVAMLAAAGTLQYGDDSRGTSLAERSGDDRRVLTDASTDRLFGKKEMTGKVAGGAAEAQAVPVQVAQSKMIAAAPPAEAEANVLSTLGVSEQSPAKDRAKSVDDGIPTSRDEETKRQNESGEKADSAARMQFATRQAAPPAGVGGLRADSSFGGAPASGELLAQAIQALQIAKVTAGLTASASASGDLRFVESTLLAALSQASVDSEDMQVVVKALERYSRAEELMESGRHAEAEAAFREANAGSRDSFVGFLAMFQMARLRFEHTGDYAGALAAYRSLLEDYPRQFMTDDYRVHVRERIDLLNRTAADNWADLRLWTAARTAPTPAAAAEELLTLLADYPTSTLAPDAATRLTELLVEDAAPQTIGYAEATRVLQETVRRREDNAQTARVQFALAEATFRRGLEPDRAILLYQRALEMKPTAELRAVIVERLKSAASARIAPAVEPVPASLPASH